MIRNDDGGRGVLHGTLEIKEAATSTQGISSNAGKYNHLTMRNAMTEDARRG